MTSHRNRPSRSPAGTSQECTNRDAFTLFEVVLAIALSTLLLALIGTAINLYLTRIEARRIDVEYAQLARTIFAMVGDDLRAASEYKPQDMSGALSAGGSSFNLGALGASGASGGGSTSSGSSGSSGSSSSSSSFSGSTSGSSSTSSGTTGNTTTNSSTTSTSTSTSTTSTGTIDAASMDTTPGVYGTLNELYIDASRPPRLDQLLSMYAGYSDLNVPNIPLTDSSNTMARTAGGQASHLALSDLKTVHYFFRQGQEVTDASSVDITSLSSLKPEMKNMIGGLVRQEIDRAQRLSAEELGDQQTLEGNQRVLAPEVVGMEFRYFDGTEVLESWDTKVNGGLPPAIEVRIWLADPNQVHANESAGLGLMAVREAAREFRQTIYLPLAKPPSTTSTTGTTGSTSSTSSTGTSSTGSSTSTGGSTP